MKKILVAIMLLVGAFVAGAQTTKVSADTTIIKSAVKFDKETFTSNKGNVKVTYQVLVDGQWYSTTKSSYERYLTIKRFGGLPTVVFIKSKNSTKVVVL